MDVKMQKKTPGRPVTALNIAILIPSLVLLGAAIAVFVVVAVIPWWQAQHPAQSAPPTELAQEYLDAIAAGDATRAHQIDGTALTKYPLANTGHELMTDDVLGSAVERISDVRVTLETASQSRARYATEFTLDGRTWSVPLEFVWDDSAERWNVEQSFAAPITVGASADSSETGAVAFTVGDSLTMSQDDDESTRLGYAAYPGVYEVTAELDPAMIVDVESTPVVQSVTVLPVEVDEPAALVFALKG